MTLRIGSSGAAAVEPLTSASMILLHQICQAEVKESVQMVGVLRASMSRRDNGSTSLAAPSFPHPEPASSVNPSHSQQLQQQSSQQLPQQHHMVCGQHPPMDWTIKTCMRFSSAEELSVCSEAAMSSSEAGESNPNLRTILAENAVPHILPNVLRCSKNYQNTKQTAKRCSRQR